MTYQVVHGDLSFLWCFPKQYVVGNILGKFQKTLSSTLISEESKTNVICSPTDTEHQELTRPRLKCPCIPIDGFMLEEALWVNRARFQGNKAAKCTFFFIFPFWVLFSRRNFYFKRRNPFSVFTSVSESIELGISLLIRVTEMLFLWLQRLRLDQIIWF